jgi:hypothetical protein
MFNRMPGRFGIVAAAATDSFSNDPNAGATDADFKAMLESGFRGN